MIFHQPLVVGKVADFDELGKNHQYGSGQTVGQKKSCTSGLILHMP
jgi:hypothetical protein